MSEEAPAWTPAQAYTPTAQVEALLDASFAAYELQPCMRCGRIVAWRHAPYCHPCEAGNSPPLFGYVETTATANERLDALLEENAALAIEAQARTAEAMALRGQLAEAQAAAVRARKGGG